MAKQKKKSRHTEKTRSPKKTKQATNAYFQVLEHKLLRAGREFRVMEAVFSNPESRNALSLEAARELSSLVKQASTCNALLVRAEGRVFCAGGNIKDHIAMGKAASLKGNREIAAACESLSKLPVPTIAIVEGDVLGGGVEFLSCFDIVLATPHVMLGFWQRRLGLVYGWGGGARLERRLGRQAVSRLAIQARAMTGREAFEIGLVDRVVAPWEIREEGLAELIRVAVLPKKPVSTLKAHSQRSSASPESRAGFEKLWFGDEHLNRMKAFSPKR